MNRLQKGEKLANKYYKLVGMVSINLLHTLSLLRHTKLAACVISIIVDEQIDLTSVFVTTAVLSYQYVIVNKHL